MSPYPVHVDESERLESLDAQIEIAVAQAVAAPSVSQLTQFDASMRRSVRSQQEAHHGDVGTKDREVHGAARV